MDQVTMTLPAADWHSVLSVLKVTIRSEKSSDSPDTDLVEALTLLYDEMNKQLKEEHGEGHVHSLYEDLDDT